MATLELRAPSRDRRLSVASGAGHEAKLSVREPSAPKGVSFDHGGKALALRGGRAPPRRHVGLRAANDFTRHVERTVDALKGTVADESYKEVRGILSHIRKQYDDVKAEADKKDVELLEVRRKISILQAEAEAGQEREAQHGVLTREEIVRRNKQVSKETKECSEDTVVYEHMIKRLHLELNLLQEKVKRMELHLNRKTGEVQKVQDNSRRVHLDKVNCISKLEAMEQEIAHERELCTAALGDLDETLRQRRGEVRHREDFERWRYEIALEAANEAFQATAGRYRKIYAIEKLTGNCLQKITFEQAETSETTENGFQRIREVTGLTDVMDIVHKFLNRDQEHEQLKNTVREAEVKLHSLREMEASANQVAEEVLPGSAAYGGDDDGEQEGPPPPKALGAEVAELETELQDAQRDKDELQKRCQRGRVMLERVVDWSRNTSKSFSTFEEMAPVESPLDLPAFFAELVQTVDRFLHHARSAMPAAKLSKLATQASGKEYAEAQKLLTDKEFIRMNCRVPASLDKVGADDRLRGKGNLANEDERQEQDFALERERLRQETAQRAINLKKNRPGLPPAIGRRERSGSVQAEEGAKEGAEPGGQPPQGGRPASQSGRPGSRSARGKNTLQLPAVGAGGEAPSRSGSRPQSAR